MAYVLYFQHDADTHLHAPEHQTAKSYFREVVDLFANQLMIVEIGTVDVFFPHLFSVLSSSTAPP